MIRTSNSVQRMAVAAHPSVSDKYLRIVEVSLKDRDGLDQIRWVSFVGDGIIDYTTKREEAEPLPGLVAARVMKKIFESYRAVFPNYPHVRVQIKPAKEDA